MLKKILLVDDSRTSLFLGTMILKKGSYEVVTACDGEEGVSKALTERQVSPLLTQGVTVSP